MRFRLSTYLALNLFFIFIISMNNVINNQIINLTLLLAIVIFSIKWDKNELIIPFFIFIWGICQDLLVGIDLGYSSLVFLFLYLVSQIASYYGALDQPKLKLIVLVSAISFIFILKIIFMYVNFGINIITTEEFLSFIIILLLYFPLNIIIVYIQNKYEKNK